MGVVSIVSWAILATKLRLQDKEGKFYILEINTVPGMTNHSCVTKSAALAGISYKKLVDLIIEDAYL